MVPKLIIAAFLVGGLLFGAFLPVSTAIAQAVPSGGDDRQIAIPPGAVIERPKDLWVQTVDKDGEAAVGRVFLRVGPTTVVELGDGTFSKRATDEIRTSERPFRPMSDKQLVLQLKQQFPSMQVESSKGYVFVHNTSPVFAQVTRRILTTMLPGIRKYARKQQLEITAPEFPLVVLMFRTRREFDALERMSDSIIAYYNPWTNYIVLYEETPLFRINRDMAIRETLSTIAHEGVHQILHNIGVQQRLSRWPMWVSEGLAEYFAPTELGQRMNWKGAGMVNDLRMLELEHYVKAKAFDSQEGEMIEHTVGAARLTSTGYATAWALTHYLAKNERSEFDDLLRELTKIGPLQSTGAAGKSGLIPQNMVLFKKYFGESLPKIEEELIEHLDKLPYTDPFAASPHVVALVTFRQGEKTGWKANIFHTHSQARQWSQQLIRKLGMEYQPRVEIHPVPNRSAGLALIQKYSRNQR